MKITVTIIPFFFILSSSSISNGAKLCPPCGSIAVPYPLSTAPDCGDPSYKVQCTANSTLTFNSLNASYPIVWISPPAQLLVIRPSPFLDAGNSCVSSDISSSGIQLNASLPFSITNSNTVMLFNCTAQLPLSSINCNTNSICHVYATATSDVAACRSTLSVCCSFVASSLYSLTVGTTTGCSAYRSFVNLDAVHMNVSEWGRRSGVELKWALPRETVCASQADCDREENYNSTCQPDPRSGGAVRRCYCSNGLSWDHFTGNCIKVVNGGDSSQDTGVKTGPPPNANDTEELKTWVRVFIFLVFVIVMSCWIACITCIAACLPCLGVMLFSLTFWIGVFFLGPVIKELCSV